MFIIQSQLKTYTMCDLLFIRKWWFCKISSNVEEWKLTFQYDRSNVNDQHLNS